jgi:hypothetical protein
MSDAYRNPLDDILDSRGLSIFMLILTLAILGFLIANVVYFRKIANDPSTSASNAKAAKNLGWINIVLAVALGIIVIYYLFKSFTNKQTRNVLYTSAGEQIAAAKSALPNVPSLGGPAFAIVPIEGKGNVTIYPRQDGFYYSDTLPGLKFTCNFNECDSGHYLASPVNTAGGGGMSYSPNTNLNYIGTPPNPNKITLTPYTQTNIKRM